MAKKRRKAENFTLAYITCPSKAVAVNLGKLFVKEGLAACANILPSMHSIYVWQGKLENSSEAVLLLKTTHRLRPKILSVLKRKHPYTLPCLLFFKIQGGNPDYLNWLAQNVRSALK